MPLSQACRGATLFVSDASVADEMACEMAWLGVVGDMFVWVMVECTKRLATDN